MNFTPSAIFAGFIFGVLGMYFLKRGKNEAELPLFAVGLILVIYPYFVENVFLLWGIGVGLVYFGFRL